MTAYDRKIYNNLSDYAKLADTENVLKHICDVLQVEIDNAFNSYERIQFLLDPETTTDSWMSFVGQMVGLSIQGSKYLGTGINPDWGMKQKRTLLLNAWKYWQKKGTEQGIREAVWLWLDWEGAKDKTKFHIIQPFGDRPLSKPPNWLSWGTLYHENLLRIHQEKSFLGAEQINNYRPNYLISKKSQPYSWHRPDEIVDLSYLGPENLWLHLILNANEWNLVFPDIIELLPEIVSAGREPIVFGWYRPTLDTEPIKIISDVPIYELIQEFKVDGFKWGVLSSINFNGGGTLLPLSNANNIFDLDSSQLWTTKNLYLIKEYLSPIDINIVFPIIEAACNANNWHLIVETDQRVYSIPLSTSFWYKNKGNSQERSFYFSLAQDFKTLFLEFLFPPQGIEHISKYSLKLEETTIQEETFESPLQLHPEINTGFQFFIPFKLSCAIVSLREKEFATFWIPKFQALSSYLQELITGNLMANLIDIPLPAISEADACLDKLEPVLSAIAEQIEILTQISKDKHYEYIIATPVTSITIEHNLGKQPAISIIDSISGTGNDIFANVKRINNNKVEINFSGQFTGRIVFN